MTASLQFFDTDNMLRQVYRSPLASPLRTFYTQNIPSTTPRTLLDDGSVLIAKHSPATPSTLPPLIRTHTARSNLSSEEIKEIRTLRQTDGDTWTVLNLARKFDTSPGLIMQVSKCPAERKEMLKEQAMEAFSRLSIGKKKRAIDRVRRKELW
jgi:Mitochondrial ribosomal protein subunit L20